MLSPSILGRSLRPLLDFIYPPTCLVCEAPIEQIESRVCPACWSTIRSLTADDPLFREMERRLREGSPSAGADHTGRPGYVAGLVSLFHFEKDGTLQSIIHQLKYGGMWSLGTELGRKLGERIVAQGGADSIDAVVPVPLHTTKWRERGYNQSECIAQGVCMATTRPLISSLVQRHKYTSSQTQLGAAERLANVGDAFSLAAGSRGHPAGKVILLVDDVITTGATIESCARVLMESGARSVFAGSVAIADHAA